MRRPPVLQHNQRRARLFERMQRGEESPWKKSFITTLNSEQFNNPVPLKNERNMINTRKKL